MNVYRPLHDYVLVLRDKPETVSRGGVIIPDSVQERPQRGTVLAVGPGRYLENGEREPIDVKRDDVVYFPKHAPADAVANTGTDPDSPVLVRASVLLAVVSRS